MGMQDDKYRFEHGRRSQGYPAHIDVTPEYVEHQGGEDSRLMVAAAIGGSLAVVAVSRMMNVAARIRQGVQGFFHEVHREGVEIEGRDIYGK